MIIDSAFHFVYSITLMYYLPFRIAEHYKVKDLATFFYWAGVYSAPLFIPLYWMGLQ